MAASGLGASKSISARPLDRAGSAIRTYFELLEPGLSQAQKGPKCVPKRDWRMLRPPSAANLSPISLQQHLITY